MSAARYMLDDEHGRLPKDKHDTNSYILGRISGHNIVIASLPEGSQGTASAAAVAIHLAGTFPAIELWLLVTVNNYKSGEIICILDALDECEDKGRSQIAEALCKFYWTGKSKSALKFLLTSRPYVHIQRDSQFLKNRLPRRKSVSIWKGSGLGRAKVCKGELIYI